ncbi:MAG: ATP-binding protein, partial [Casimicrobiaceae bacterium]
LDNVVAGSDRAARLVEQLLTLARLEPDQLKEQVRPCDLREIARHTIAELAPAALERGTEIELDAEAVAPVEGHPELIAALLRNLIDNAVRYGPTGGVVRVETQGASVSVTDQGPGIPPEERARVGERFYRILGTEPSGSGLGLSIVERIATLHGAQVALGEGPGGRGLRATVAFRA